MRLLIYTPTLTPRVQYAWEVLLRYVLKTDFELTTDLETYLRSDACKINYSNERRNPSEVFIPAGKLLFESGIRPQQIDLFRVEQLPAFFQQSAQEVDFPFDFPSLVFYLISRYEEYLPYERDVHGRFPARASLAYREGFLQQPLVNQWACRLRELLEARFPGFTLPKLTYRFQPTYDVDMAWAYHYKGWVRNISGAFRDFFKGNFQDIIHRFRVLSGVAEDPFYSFPYLEQLHRQLNLKPIFFFLLGDYGNFDKNISPRQPALRELIHQIHRRYPIGIHPSYQSDGQPAQIRREVQRLKEITEDPVVRSRQHFLLLRLPQTYRELLGTGITSDYTMGFAAETGFRASIATPYPWYDLEKEQATSLMVHPFQVMDVTLKNYLRFQPEEAVARVGQLIEATKAVNGTFSTIWHNSSFSKLEKWHAWREVYEVIVKMATKSH